MISPHVWHLELEIRGPPWWYVLFSSLNCHRHSLHPRSARCTSGAENDARSAGLPALGAAPVCPAEGAKLEIFWNKEHGETNGWVVRFTKIHRVFTKKWRAVLCATYLASFCVLHLPDRIRLHSVRSSGSVGGIYLNIFESGFSLRQSWQVWKLIGTSHMSQQRMKGFWRSLAVWAGEHVNEDLPAHMFFHHLEAIYPYRKQWEHTKHEIIGKTDLSVFADVSYPEWHMCLVRGDQFRTCIGRTNSANTCQCSTKVWWYNDPSGGCFILPRCFLAVFWLPSLTSKYKGSKQKWFAFTPGWVCLSFFIGAMVVWLGWYHYWVDY